MIANILPSNQGQKVKIQLFQNMVMLHIQFKGMTHASPSFDPPGWTKGVGQRQIFNFFSEHGHIAYQIKLNHECSNTAANILPADPPPRGHIGVGVKMSQFDFFRTWSCFISN